MVEMFRCIKPSIIEFYVRVVKNAFFDHINLIIQFIKPELFYRASNFNSNLYRLKLCTSLLFKKQCPFLRVKE